MLIKLTSLIFCVKILLNFSQADEASKAIFMGLVLF